MQVGYFQSNLHFCQFTVCQYTSQYHLRVFPPKWIVLLNVIGIMVDVFHLLIFKNRFVFVNPVGQVRCVPNQTNVIVRPIHFVLENGKTDPSVFVLHIDLVVDVISKMISVKDQMHSNVRMVVNVFHVTYEFLLINQQYVHVPIVFMAVNVNVIVHKLIL